MCIPQTSCFSCPGAAKYDIFWCAEVILLSLAFIAL